MSKSEEIAAANLAAGNVSLAELVDALRTQRAIGETMREIVRSGPIPETASMIPAKPLPPAEPPAPGTGWAKPQGLEMPLGESGQRLIEEMVNAALPHGVKPKT